MTVSAERLPLRRRRRASMTRRNLPFAAASVVSPESYRTAGAVLIIGLDLEPGTKRLSLGRRGPALATVGPATAIRPSGPEHRCQGRLHERQSTGLALGLLDQWLAGHDTDAPAGLATMTSLPAGHWTGERAATDILTLARKGRAFASLDSLIVRQGGQHILYGSALVLAAALQSWARHTQTPLTGLARTAVR